MSKNQECKKLANDAYFRALIGCVSDASINSNLLVQENYSCQIISSATALDSLYNCMRDKINTNRITKQSK